MFQICELLFHFRQSIFFVDSNSNLERRPLVPVNELKWKGFDLTSWESGTKDVNPYIKQTLVGKRQGRDLG